MFLKKYEFFKQWFENYFIICIPTYYLETRISYSSRVFKDNRNRRSCCVTSKSWCIELRSKLDILVSQFRYYCREISILLRCVQILILNLLFPDNFSSFFKFQQNLESYKSNSIRASYTHRHTQIQLEIIPKQSTPCCTSQKLDMETHIWTHVWSTLFQRPARRR